MKKFLFKVQLSGYGDTADKAWEDATESFAQDPGSTPDPTEYSIEDEEE